MVVTAIDQYFLVFILFQFSEPSFQLLHIYINGILKMSKAGHFRIRAIKLSGCSYIQEYRIRIGGYPTAKCVNGNVAKSNGRFIYKAHSAAMAGARRIMYFPVTVVAARETHIFFVLTRCEADGGSAKENEEQGIP